MGTVYLAEHTVMGWKAAIKVLRRSLADDKVLVRRFINEARVIKAVRHPNIVEIVDVGILPDGLPYLLMELLEGETVGARLHRCGRMTVEQALDIASQTALALQAAHEKGIIHRDLKPDNLFLVRDSDHPGQEKVKVLDFGIAKLADADSGSPSAHTRSGVLLGTPAYMSPEQCRGIAESVDHRADVYALSVILHQMLAGRAPFVGAGTGDVLIMHVSADPPPVAQDNPAVPRFVEAAILKGLAKAREDRFQSMAALAAALNGEGAASRPPADPTLQIPPPPFREPLRATESMATVATPLSWSPGGPTGSTRKLSRRAMGFGVVAALAVPLLIVVAADGIRWTSRPQPAIAPARAEPGGLTRGATVAAPPPAPTVPPAAAPTAVPPAATERPPARLAAPAAADTPAAPASGTGRAPASRKPARRAKAPAPGAPATAVPAAPAPPPRRAKPWL